MLKSSFRVYTLDSIDHKPQKYVLKVPFKIGVPYEYGEEPEFDSREDALDYIVETRLSNAVILEVHNASF